MRLNEAVSVPTFYGSDADLNGVGISNLSELLWNWSGSDSSDILWIQDPISVELVTTNVWSYDALRYSSLVALVY